MKTLSRLLRDERGLETVEYAILVGMILGALVLVLAAIGTWVVTQFTGFRDAVGA